MRDVTVAITEASYSGNKGAAAMLQSSISQLHEQYGERLTVNLMSVYPSADRKQVPFDFVKVVPAKPEQVLFIAFPLAVLYWLLHWIPPVKTILLKHPVIKAYSKTDLVLNEAGVSFVDSRGFVMNVYSFVCAAIPMLMGVPVIKYSQALGTFKSFYNRFLAKWQLPAYRKIIARGEGTRKNLEEIGIAKNVVVMADGAFSMKDDPAMTEKVGGLWADDPFFHSEVVGLSISNVVCHKCEAMGIDYVSVISQFIEELNHQGYHVLILANAARIGSTKTRTNDLMLGDRVFAACKDHESVRWYHEEMTAEELREHIGRCRFLVASRFHSMIAGLERCIPVMLIGWSHKYQEVLDMFELGEYAADFSSLSLDGLKQSFDKLKNDEQLIISKEKAHLSQVRESSLDNIRLVSRELDEIITGQKVKKHALDFNAAEKYAGKYISIRKGYALKDEDRKNAASGGVVTALLCNLLRHGDIDGAWVTKTEITDGKIGYKTWIATTEEEIRDASSSIYMNMPLLKHLDMVKEFSGKIAVVMQPCMLKALTALMEKDPSLRDKIKWKFGLFCSGSCDVKATELALQKAGVTTENGKRLYYRRGFWRGPGAVVYQDDSEATFSYTDYFCTYKNAYYFHKESCFGCDDHYAASSDISFGDIWLKEMKKENIKHTGCVIRNQQAQDLLDRAIREKDITARFMSGRDLIRSQKRELVFKNLVFAKEGHRKWNHALAGLMVKNNRNFVRKHPKLFEKIPVKIVFFRMALLRVLLNF